jgi:surfeit locus 1 family protein
VRRFPIGLTIAAAIAFAVLIGLRVWQLQRLAWKERLLADVAALRNAPAQPIAPVLHRAAVGADVAFIRVEVTCQPSAAPAAFRYAVRGGTIAWRLLTACRLPSGPFDGVILDRGLVASDSGHMAPRPADFAAPGEVVGVLRELGARPLLGGEDMDRPGAALAFRVVDRRALARLAAAAGLARPAPLLLAVEGETPALAGVSPAPLPESIPNNHLGYALTWFGLALALAWIWAARVFGAGS